MKYQLLVRRAAVNDIADAEEFYELQQPGLGTRFRDEVARTLQRIQGNPIMYPTTEVPRYRRAVLNIFPFNIYYCVARQRVGVVAVLDARRDPGTWRERVK